MTEQTRKNERTNEDAHKSVYNSNGHGDHRLKYVSQLAETTDEVEWSLSHKVNTEMMMIRSAYLGRSWFHWNRAKNRRKKEMQLNVSEAKRNQVTKIFFLLFYLYKYKQYLLVDFYGAEDDWLTEVYGSQTSNHPTTHHYTIQEQLAIWRSRVGSSLGSSPITFKLASICRRKK